MIERKIMWKIVKVWHVKSTIYNMGWDRTKFNLMGQLKLWIRDIKWDMGCYSAIPIDNGKIDER